ncbi:lytic transglycosylase domain-containing protein [Tsuneonella flava]|uniref:Lytic transglycosylase domain-containing protein n=1 Tax=Tsuneonella flava TaxID=2055955 RepID=A0ABX7K8X3_9SPHN|nr:lytic transglycosylase domain-containing protein [Tsuneonella flava]QSB44434.1 lytic transglycosylase domain-containing protein [Tsuneonella flava]
MILAHAGRLTFAVVLAFCAIPAKADVMQIDGDGARWVSGALANGAVADVASGHVPDIVELSADFTVPDQAVADAARQAGAVPQTYAAKVAELSRRFDLSPALIEALVWQESRWRPDAVSPVGARGLAQLMPDTAREMGVNPHDPFANLEGGARYLREQLDRFGGDLEKALAAYNAGPGRVTAANGIPRIRETQQYVAAIMGRLSNHSRGGQ